MTIRHSTWTRPVAILCAIHLLAPLPAHAQTTVKQDFRESQFNADALRYDSDESMKYVTPEKEGLRIRFAPPDVPRAAVGVRWKTAVIGDFEATARYEILKIEPATKGYGVGIELYGMLENPERKQADGLAFARIMLTKGDLVLGFSHRANDEMEKRVTRFGKFHPTTAASDRGRLRMARTAGTLTASIAEGDSDTFKEVMRTQVGDANIRMIRIAGLPAHGGDPKATLDLRILDMELKGTLPGLENLNLPKKVLHPAAPDGVPMPEPTQSPRWFLLIAILLALGLSIIAAAVLVIAWLRSASAPARKNAGKGA
ncbi:MAG TPA: DUF1583 domain-containing protein [Gemmataceae bacterium]|nr:DUF1583 domain-containing protein [Gemmataceae bacterium]